MSKGTEGEKKMKRNDLRMEELVESIREEIGMSHDEYIDRSDLIDMWKTSDSEDEFIKDVKFYLGE